MSGASILSLRHRNCICDRGGPVASESSIAEFPVAAATQTEELPAAAAANAAMTPEVRNCRIAAAAAKFQIVISLPFSYSATCRSYSIPETPAARSLKRQANMPKSELKGTAIMSGQFNEEERKGFIKLIEEIESTLDSYDPGELAPDKIIGEIFKERAKQRPILEKAVQLATEGLEKYPFNPALLRMRAFARCRIVTPEGEFPELELAEQDLRTILEFDPDNLKTGFELLEMMFTFSGMEDKDVAEVARKFAAMAEELLLCNLALQIKALGYAHEHSNAEEVYNKWIKLFPESEELKSAKADSDSMKPDQ